MKRSIFWVLGVIAAMVIIGFSVQLWRQNKNNVAKQADVDASVQTILGDKCSEEMKKSCGALFGMQAYQCLRKIPKQELSSRCADMFSKSEY